MVTDNNTSTISLAFWEDDLEMPTEQHIANYKDPGIREKWLKSLSNCQVAVLSHILEISSSEDVSSSQRQALALQEEILAPYYLVSHFARYKNTHVVTTLADATLTPEKITLCKDATDAYDKIALLFLLFWHNPLTLKEVYLFDKVQKNSFAPYRLESAPPRPSFSLVNVLTPERINTLVATLNGTTSAGGLYQFISLSVFSSVRERFLSFCGARKTKV